MRARCRIPGEALKLVEMANEVGGIKDMSAERKGTYTKARALSACQQRVERSRDSRVKGVQQIKV